MLNILISFLCLMFMGVSFTYGVNYTGVHRTFLLLNSTLIKEAVATADDDYNLPYFNKNILEETCLNFFGNNLGKYTKKFDVGFYYFDGSSGEFCNDKCNSVRISLKADLIFDISYSNAFIYKIEVS